MIEHNKSLRIQQALSNIQSKESEKRKEAIQVLRETRYIPGIPLLIKSLQDNVMDVRLAAARAMGEIVDEQTISGILNQMRDVWITSARRIAAELMGMHNDSAVIPGLIWLMRDKSMVVRRAAAESLDRLGWKPAEHDQDNRVYYALAMQQWDVLWLLGDQAVEVLANYLFNNLGNEAEEPVEHVVSVLKKIHSPDSLAVLAQWEHLNRSVTDIALKSTTLEIVPPQALLQSTDNQASDLTRNELTLLPIKDTLVDAVFAVYFPQYIRPDTWQNFHAYISRWGSLGQVEADAMSQLQQTFRSFHRPGRSPSHFIPEGELVTVIPYLPGYQFNPPNMTFGFFEAWHRLDFKLRPLPGIPAQPRTGALTFVLSGMVIAEVPLTAVLTETDDDIPIIAQLAEPYSSIFTCYSPEDPFIAEQILRAYQLLGMDELHNLTVHTHKEADDEARLPFIDQVDIFQLFWSEAARQSSRVEKEWRHALSLDNKSVNFIRPVYWHKPAPPIPDALRHIPFLYQPDLLR